MAIPIPADVRRLLEAPNYVHLVDPAGGRIAAKLGGMGRARGRPDPGVHLGRDLEGQGHAARPARRAVRHRHVQSLTAWRRSRAASSKCVRDEGCRYMDPISIKYTGAPFPSRGPDRVCFVIAVEKAAPAYAQPRARSGLTLGVPRSPRSPPARPGPETPRRSTQVRLSGDTAAARSVRLDF